MKIILLTVLVISFFSSIKLKTEIQNDELLLCGGQFMKGLRLTNEVSSSGCLTLEKADMEYFDRFMKNFQSYDNLKVGISNVKAFYVDYPDVKDKKCIEEHSIKNLFDDIEKEKKTIGIEFPIWTDDVYKYLIKNFSTYRHLVDEYFSTKDIGKKCKAAGGMVRALVRMEPFKPTRTIEKKIK
jgi:hypothetical protein